MSGQVSGGSAGEYQADERAGVARLSWRVTSMTTGKIIAFPIGTFVGKVMCLLFNAMSRLVIAFLPRSKWLPISWL